MLLAATGKRGPGRRASWQKVCRRLAATAVMSLATLLTACLLTIAPLQDGPQDTDIAPLADGGDASDGGCDGYCLPVLLSSALGSEPWGIYVSGNGVFFVTRYAGQVVEVQDTASPIVAPLAGPVAIVGSPSSTLYWTMSGAVTGGMGEDVEIDAATAGLGFLGFPTTNGLAMQRTVAELGVPPGTAPFDIRVLDDGDLAWSASSLDATTAGGVFRSDPKLSSNTQTISTVVASYNYLSTDGSHVWATGNHDRAVYRIDSDAAAKNEMLLYSVEAGSLAPSDWRSGKLYVAAYEGGFVGVIDDPLAGTEQSLRLIVEAGTLLPPTPLQPDGGLAVDAVYDVKTDEQFVYWTNKNEGSIVRAPLDGGPPEAIVYLPEAGVSKLFITGDTIYFTALGNGSVYKVAK